MRIERYFSPDRNVVKHFPHHECKNLKTAPTTLIDLIWHALAMVAISGTAAVVYRSGGGIFFLLLQCNGLSFAKSICCWSLLAAADHPPCNATRNLFPSTQPRGHVTLRSPGAGLRIRGQICSSKSVVSLEQPKRTLYRVTSVGYSAVFGVQYPTILIVNRSRLGSVSYVHCKSSTLAARTCVPTYHTHKIKLRLF
jgi:hypothetical protein